MIRPWSFDKKINNGNVDGGKLHHDLIQPHPHCDVILWGLSCSVQIYKAFKSQAKAIRIICNLKQRESCRLFFNKLKLPTVVCCYIKKVVQYAPFGTVTGNNHHHYNTRYIAHIQMIRCTSALSATISYTADIKFHNKLPHTWNLSWIKTYLNQNSLNI